MARQALILSAFLLFLNISLVLCRDDYNQYFSNHFSHHHRKSTPQDGVPSAEAAVSQSEGIVESSGKQHGVHSTEDAVSLDAESSSPGVPNIAAVKTAGENNGQQHSYSSYNSYNNSVLITRIAIIVGAVAFFLVALCVIIWCRPACCRGKRNPGFILSNNTAQVVNQPQQIGPESPLMHTFPPAQQFPNYPTGYGLQPVQQHYSPEQQQFQAVQGQQQYQYPPTQEQYHNPPVAPPPYSEKY